MTLAEALAAAARTLEAAEVEAPRREARLLLTHATGLDLAAQLRHSGDPMPSSDFAALVARRAAREPMALITGGQGFWSLDLAVSAATLIPRADSEALIEAALALRPDRAVARILDLGTGTGCLLLAALTEFPDAWGLGVDLSPAAVALARRNAAALGLAHRTAFIAGDWAAAVDARFDLVLANPPYIPTAEIAGLMEEVALHEPRSALDGGGDGLDAYRRIVAALPALLTQEGAAILELGIGQAEAVAGLARGVGLHVHPPYLDLAGVERACVATKKPVGGFRPGV